MRGRRPSVRSLGGSVVLLGLVLSACTGEAPAPEPTTAGPLTDYTSEFVARVLARAEREQLAGAEAVAACMKGQGFDHAPFVGWSVTTSTTAPDQGTEDWAEQHGYGLVDGTAYTSSRPTDQDPNAELVAAMSAAERAAYDRALQGPPDAPQDGCLALAPDPADAWTDETYQHHTAEAARLEEGARDAPAVTGALETWRTCMDDEGVPGYDSPEAASSEVTARVQAAETRGPGTVPARLRDELLDLERRVATASVRCDERSELGRRVADAVRDAQVAYVEQHRAELDAWALTWPDPADPDPTAG